MYNLKEKIKFLMNKPAKFLKLFKRLKSANQKSGL